MSRRPLPHRFSSCLLALFVALVAPAVLAQATSLDQARRQIEKTGAALDAARGLLDRFEAHHILIIGPLLVAQNTWPDEIETRAHTRAISYAVAPLVSKKRKRLNARTRPS